MTEEVVEGPNWLKELEEKRERRLKGKLGHESGAGSPCLTCKEACPGLDLHFWRKICKNCKCGKESHDVQDDDIYGMVQFQLLGSKPNKSNKIVLPGKKEEVELEWAPKGQKEIVENYLKELPQELLPVKGSAAAQERKQQLQKQIPLHDIDPSLCHALTTEEIDKMNSYIEDIKAKSIGIGQIVQLNTPQANATLVSNKPIPHMQQNQLSVNIKPNRSESLSPKKINLPDIENNLKNLNLYYKKLDDLPETVLREVQFGIRDIIYDQSLNYPSKKIDDSELEKRFDGSKNSVVLTGKRNSIGAIDTMHLNNKLGKLPNYNLYNLKLADIPENILQQVQLGWRDIEFDTNVIHDPVQLNNIGLEPCYCKEKKNLVLKPKKGYYPIVEEKYPICIGNLENLAGALQYAYPEGLIHNFNTSNDVNQGFNMGSVNAVQHPYHQSGFMQNNLSTQHQPWGVNSPNEYSRNDNTGNLAQYPYGNANVLHNPHSNINNANSSRLYQNTVPNMYDNNDRLNSPVTALNNRLNTCNINEAPGGLYPTNYDPYDNKYATINYGEQNLSPDKNMDSVLSTAGPKHGTQQTQDKLVSENNEPFPGLPFDSNALNAAASKFNNPLNLPKYSDFVKDALSKIKVNDSVMPIEGTPLPPLDINLLSADSDTAPVRPELPIGYNPQQNEDNAINRQPGQYVPHRPYNNYNPNYSNVQESVQNPACVNIGAINDITYPNVEVKTAPIHENEHYQPPNVYEKDDVVKDAKNQLCYKCGKGFDNDSFAITLERNNAMCHVNCLKCAGCNQIIADMIYFYDKESDDIYCGRDYAKIRGYHRCSACDELIFVKEYCLAENMTFHVKHFCCFDCDTPLAGQRYVIDDNLKPICLPCYEKFNSEHCNTCKKPIQADEQGAKLENVHFHADDACFSCKVCRKPLLGSKFKFSNTYLYCSAECFNKGQ